MENREINQRNMQECSCQRNSHVHEVVGSVKIEGECLRAHNHRFAGVTGKEIWIGNGQHIHEICFRTDSFDGHNHEFMGRFCPAIETKEGHTHFLEGVTSKNSGHRHCFKVLALIEDPIEE